MSRKGHKASISDIPKDANSDLDKLNPMYVEYKHKRNTRLCSYCFEMDTKIVSYDYRVYQLINNTVTDI